MNWVINNKYAVIRDAKGGLVFFEAALQFSLTSDV